MCCEAHGPGLGQYGSRTEQHLPHSRNRERPEEIVKTELPLTGGERHGGCTLCYRRTVAVALAEDQQVWLMSVDPVRCPGVPLVARCIGTDRFTELRVTANRQRYRWAAVLAQYYQFPMFRHRDGFERWNPHEGMGVAVDNHEPATFGVSQCTNTFL